MSVATAQEDLMERGHEVLHFETHRALAAAEMLSEDILGVREVQRCEARTKPALVLAVEADVNLPQRLDEGGVPICDPGGGAPGQRMLGREGLMPQIEQC